MRRRNVTTVTLGAYGFSVFEVVDGPDPGDPDFRYVDRKGRAWDVVLPRARDGHVTLRRVADGLVRGLSLGDLLQFLANAGE